MARHKYTGDNHQNRVQKDGRAKNGRLAGMKNRQKGKIAKKRKKLNSKKKPLDDYQDTTRKEFLLRKAGESQEQWEKRTLRRRVYGRSKDNNIRLASDGKIVNYSRPLKCRQKEVKLIIQARFHERPYDFLKVYAFVMRWASVRHDVLKEDIELGYYFYSGEPFTKEDFSLACIQLGTVRGVFTRFYKNGYIVPVSVISRIGTVKDIGYYSLSMEFQLLIKRVYGVLSKVTPAGLSTKHLKAKQDEELIEFMLKLNTEIEETIRGEKNQDKILFRNEEN